MKADDPHVQAVGDFILASVCCTPFCNAFRRERAELDALIANVLTVRPAGEELPIPPAEATRENRIISTFAAAALLVGGIILDRAWLLLAGWIFR